MNWESVQTVLHYVSGPIIGAIIGYITNFIAVKMLFHPYKPIKIFGFTLPFTPGIIPKRKTQLAKAISHAVSDKLFTEDDLSHILCSDKIKDTVSGAICDKAEELYQKSPMEIALSVTSEENAQEFKSKTCDFVSSKVMESAKEIDMGALIAEKGFDVIKEKKSSMGMLGMFISDELISSLLEQLKLKINEFIDTEGEFMIGAKAKEKIDLVCSAPLCESIGINEINWNAVKEKVGDIYESIVKRALSSIAGQIDIASVVEAKVNAMTVKELEALCLSVMKRELGAVVNLGALIGFIIGIINIFV